MASSAPEVRLIEPGEVGAWIESATIPFLEGIANEEDRAKAARWAPHIEAARTWAVDQDGRFVGNGGSLTRTVTMPGAPDAECPVIPFAAVTAVGVHPTHRRRGLLRKLMGAMLDDARQRGEAIAGLQASESSIYGRFGFGWSVSACRLSLDTRHSTFAVAAPEVDIDLVLGEDAAKVVPAAFERARRRSPGQVDRTEALWADTFADRSDERRGASAMMWAVCDGGVAAFRAQEVREPSDDAWARLLVRDLVGETAEIEAALWRFVADVDLVREVVVSPRPYDDPIRHRLVDPRRVRTLKAEDFLWLRVLDTPAALTARGYLRAGRLVLDVRAPAATPTGDDGADGPDPAVGRWTLDAAPEGTTCRAATAAESTDLTMGVAELGSILAGEVRATTLAAAGRIDEGRPGALFEADALFASARPPHSLTGF